MASSNDIYKQMQAVIKEQSKYTPGNLGDITADLSARVNNFAPQYQELRKAEGDTYQLPTVLMQKYQTDRAAQGGGPGALQQLNSILGLIGQRYGTTNMMRDMISQGQGRIGDIARNVSDTYAQQGQNLMNKYQMLSPLYQTQVQKEEGAANRAAQKRAAQQQAIDLSKYMNQGASGQLKALQDKYDKLMRTLNTQATVKNGQPYNSYGQQIYGPPVVR